MTQPKQTRGPRSLGISRVARRLGVTRQHLYLVLKGQRPGVKLLQRYRALQVKRANKLITQLRTL